MTAKNFRRRGYDFYLLDHIFGDDLLSFHLETRRILVTVSIVLKQILKIFLR